MTRLGTPRPGGSVRGQASALKHCAAPNLVDMLGQLIGNWFVVSREESDARGEVRWLCQCDKCGDHRVMTGGVLRYRPYVCRRCRNGSQSIVPSMWGAGQRDRARQLAEDMRAVKGVAPAAHVEPPARVRAIDLDELPVFRHLVRCSTCQSFQGFVGGRCLNCGRETSEMLPHVEGPKPQRREHV